MRGWIVCRKKIVSSSSSSYSSSSDNICITNYFMWDIFPTAIQGPQTTPPQSCETFCKIKNWRYFSSLIGHNTIHEIIVKIVFAFNPALDVSLLSTAVSRSQSLSREVVNDIANEFDILQLYLFLFLYIFRLDVHLVATHHYPKDSFHCEHCSKSYCYRPSLLRHRAVVHGEYRKYPCENCSKVSPSLCFSFLLQL